MSTRDGKGILGHGEGVRLMQESSPFHYAGANSDWLGLRSHCR